MIGRWLCRRGRHRWLLLTRPLVVDLAASPAAPPHPGGVIRGPVAVVAAVCTRCSHLARYDVDGALG